MEENFNTHMRIKLGAMFQSLVMGVMLIGSLNIKSLFKKKKMSGRLSWGRKLVSIDSKPTDLSAS
jgi:hypothetical protein